MPQDVPNDDETSIATTEDRNTSAEVANWLTSIGMAQYIEAFEIAEIDMDILPHLSYLDLKELGVEWQKERIDILKKAADHFTSPVKPPPAIWRARKRTNNGEFKPNKPASNNHPPKPPNGKLKQLSLSAMLSHNTKPTSRLAEPTPQPVSTGTAKNGALEVWQSIPGTDFIVDRFKKLAGLTSRHWFLTHFHSDHYGGLTKAFKKGEIYCSPVTAKLVEKRLGVGPDRLRPIPLNNAVTLNGARVTFLDANHCPGAVMIVVEGLNGQPVLHTGDARLTRETYDNATLQRLREQGCHLVLDTTYCDPKYSFPSQSSVIEYVCNTVLTELFHAKTLFLFGTYGIGKERLFLEVAKKAKRSVYVARDKMAALECMELTEEERALLTTDHAATNLHAIALWKVTTEEGRRLLSSYGSRFTHVVGFRPTGWSFARGVDKTAAGCRSTIGKVTIHQVPYSEHSSFSELREFVQWLQPVQIVPSVGNDQGTKRQQMLSWLKQKTL